MRKSRIIIEGLQRRVAEAEKQRDEARNAVHEGIARLHRHSEDHSGAMAKLGEDLSGLADVVRAAVAPKAAPEPEPEAPAAPAAEAPAEIPMEPVTPAAKRGTSKAAG